MIASYITLPFIFIFLVQSLYKLGLKSYEGSPSDPNGLSRGVPLRLGLAGVELGGGVVVVLVEQESH